VRAAFVVSLTALVILLGADLAHSVVTPRVAISATGAGYGKKITVSVTTPSGKPVRGATVLASATMNASGHFMSVAPARLAQRSRGVYGGSLRFAMPGQWVVKVDVSGPSINPVTSRLTIRL
jgi:YtkA-like